jgi:predicted Zn-dependent protease
LAVVGDVAPADWENAGSQGRGPRLIGLERKIMHKTLTSFRLCWAALALAVLGACATSPTGRYQFMLVSEDQAIVASRQAYRETIGELQKEGKLSTDKALRARVDKITGRLVAQAILMRPDTRAWEWNIEIIDDPDTINAWAMAGGKMALYTGLIEKIEPSDDELAQVLGHEISHALAKHSAERMSVTMATQLGVLAVGVATDQPGRNMAMAAVAAQLAISLPNSRAAETEADRIGIELAAKAGYDPRAAATLWRKMGQVEQGGRPPAFLATHPSPANREQTLNALAPQMMAFYQRPGSRPSYPLN